MFSTIKAVWWEDSKRAAPYLFITLSSVQTSEMCFGTWSCKTARKYCLCRKQQINVWGPDARGSVLYRWECWGLICRLALQLMCFRPVWSELRVITPARFVTDILQPFRSSRAEVGFSYSPLIPAAVSGQCIYLAWKIWRLFLSERWKTARDTNQVMSVMCPSEHCFVVVFVLLFCFLLFSCMGHK